MMSLAELELLHPWTLESLFKLKLGSIAIEGPRSGLPSGNPLSQSSAKSETIASANRAWSR